MQFFNHYTMNSQDMRVSYPSEVDKSIYFILKSIFESEDEYKQVIDNLYADIACEPNCYTSTLYLKKQGEYIPVLVSLGCSDESKARYVWDCAYSMFKNSVPFPPSAVPLMPAAPFVIDVILPTYILLPKRDMSLTGDLTRCMGWMMLDPKAVVKDDN